MAVRTLGFGLMLGLTNLAAITLAPLSSAQAAYPGWSSYSAPANRPQFRPVHRSERTTTARWRPAAIAVARSRSVPGQFAGMPRLHSRLIVAPTTSIPNAARSDAASRGSARFRPLERSGTDRSSGVERPTESVSVDALHAQFRPPQVRKPAYRSPYSPGWQPHHAGTGMTYGWSSAPMVTAYQGGFWPRW